MVLHTCPAFEVFLTEKDLKPDFFILIDGKVQITNKAHEDFQVGPYEIFGFTEIFTKKPWIPGKITAKEPCTIVSIKRSHLKSLMQAVDAIKENARLLEFITQFIPGLKQLGQAGKERILSFFEKTLFKNGDFLLKEGKICECAYIIESGECKLISVKNPGIKVLPVYQGLISKTTSCFNLGMATVGEWVGEESIILNKGIEFSVIAAVNVVALKISSEDFLEGLGRDIQGMLRLNVEKKIRWRKERKRNISQAISENVAKTDKNDEIDLEKTEKRYPVASKSTIKVMRKTQKAKNVLNSSISKLRYSENLNQPQSSFSSVNTSRILSSPIPSNAKSNNNSISLYPTQRNSSNIKLYTASTLGYSMIPVMSVKTEVKRKNDGGIRRNKDVWRGKANLPKCYAERVRNGRPCSPNPAEIWARKHNIRLLK